MIRSEYGAQEAQSNPGANSKEAIKERSRTAKAANGATKFYFKHMLNLCSMLETKTGKQISMPEILYPFMQGKQSTLGRHILSNQASAAKTLRPVKLIHSPCVTDLPSSFSLAHFQSLAFLPQKFIDLTFSRPL
jgi:hypothetical protein